MMVMKLYEIRETILSDIALLWHRRYKPLLREYFVLPQGQEK